MLSETHWIHDSALYQERRTNARKWEQEDGTTDSFDKDAGLEDAMLVFTCNEALYGKSAQRAMKAELKRTRR
jgi:hypothetical protein